MNRQTFWGVVLTVVAASATSTSPLKAQPPQPGGGVAPRPTFSPYLNLARSGGSPALNYYGIVRPEVEARQAIQNLQGVTSANQQAIGDIQNGPNDLPTTGHQASFLTHHRYFMTGGASGGGGSGGGGSSGGGIGSGGGGFSAPTRGR